MASAAIYKYVSVLAYRTISNWGLTQQDHINGFRSILTNSKEVKQIREQLRQKLKYS